MTSSSTQPDIRVDAAFSVREFGAVGDGVANDTSAMQAAIDACAANGGGRVLIPSGRFRSGTLYLRSNIDLHLSIGATIVASSDRADYNPDDAFPFDVPLPAERVTAAHLIIAYEQKNVSITGPGTIDGSSAEFLTDPTGHEQNYRFIIAKRRVREWRPAQMLFFFRCTQVRLDGVRLINAPYWTVYLFCCTDVHVQGLTIENPADTPNSDGIDVVSCRNVVISNTIMRTGDDCLVVRTRNRRLDADPPCENVTVSNCVLSSPTSAIRIGVDDGVVRNCVFSNIVVTETRTAIILICRYNQNVHHGTAIENLHFSDFVVDACVPFSLVAGPGAAAPAAISDISFSRFRVTASAGSQLLGNSEVPLRRIRFSDVTFTVVGGTTNTEFAAELPEPLGVSGHGGYSGRNGQSSLPCVLYATHVDGLELNDVRVEWREVSDVWHDGIRLDHVNGADLHRVILSDPHPVVPSAGTAAIRAHHTTALSLQGCRALPGTNTFLDLDETTEAGIPWLFGNDLREAGA